MSRTEITTPEALTDESVVELSLRPQRLEEFIGQGKVKDALRIYIDAATARKEPLDHTLLFGPPGLGKTTLAELIAREMGVNIHTTSGPALEKPGDLVGTLTNLRAGDILFIDEIHRLKPVIDEFLYPAMEDWKIDIRLSEGPKAQTITMPIERFTLIGATTRLGMLTAPLRARFGIELRLNYYRGSRGDRAPHRSGDELVGGRRGRQGTRASCAWDAARGESPAAPRARLRAGEGQWQHHARRGPRGAGHARRGRVRPG